MSVGRVVAVCAGCGKPIMAGTGWRKRRNPEADSGFGARWLDYHHEEVSEPTGEYTLDGQYRLRAVTVVASCLPKDGDG